MTLLTLLEKAASGNSAGITFIDAGGAEERITYRDLFRQAMYIAGSLQHQGMKAGDELVIRVESNKTFLYLFWGCIIGKFIPIPLSAGWRDEQANRLVRVWKYLTHPFLASDGTPARHIALLQDTSPETTARDLQDRILPLDTLLEPDHEFQAAPVAGQDLAYVQFSSGSTGNPQGVRLTHHNLICNIHDIIKSLAITEQDVLLSWMPLTHDMGIIGFHLTGLAKGIDAVCIATAAFVRRPLIWMDKASKHKASVLYSPNFGLHYLLSALRDDKDHGWDLSPIRILINGAETISVRLCNRFNIALQKYGLHASVIVTAYGLAEAAVEVTAMPVGTPVKSYDLKREFLHTGEKIQLAAPGSADSVNFVDVGFPVSSCSLRICTGEDEPLPENTIGQIQIKGDNVTAGYYNNPDATKEVLTKDEWLKTGDLGFIRENRLVVTGRMKNIIVLNGQNYYPSDIERVITDAGIAELGKVAACGTRNALQDIDELVIFILWRSPVGDFAPIVRSVRETIASNIGIYAAKVIPVKKIPRTTSGKIQHFLLREKYINGAFDEFLQGSAYISGNGPVTKMPDKDLLRQQLASLVGDLLGRPDIDPGQDLFEMGLNSMIAIQLSGRLQRQMGIAISIQDIFEHFTLDSLAGCLCNTAGAADWPVFCSMDQPSSAGVSLAQRRIWAECRLHKDPVAYNIPLVYKVNGELQVAVLERSFRELIKKYEILRTSFELGKDHLLQVVHDYSDTLFAVEKADIVDYDNIINTHFRLESPSQFRVCIIKNTGHEHLLIMVFHHILTDGWSLGLLMQELTTLYNNGGKSQALSPEKGRPFQFTDYAAWQKKILRCDAMELARKYWLKELKDANAPVGLGGKPEMSLGGDSIPVKSHRFSFGPDAQRTLEQLAKRYHTTSFCTLMSLLTTLIYRYTNSKDITIGFDVTGRISEDLEQLVGYALNTLCLRVFPDGNQSFADMTATVKNKLYQAFQHQLYPFEQLSDDLARYQGVYEFRLFNILVLYQNFYGNNEGPGFKDCHFTRQHACAREGVTDLVLEFTESDTGLELNILYNGSLYDECWPCDFSDHLLNLLLKVANEDTTAIYRHDFLTDRDKAIVLPAANRRFDTKHIKMPVHRIFEKSAAATPGDIAVIAGIRIMTYKELNTRANSIAWYLKNRYNIIPGDTIGFLVSRDESIPVAILAILKAGGAFIALDPDFPARRWSQIADDSGVKCILVNDETFEKSKEAFDESFLVNLDHTDIYSQTTGDPVGNISLNNLAYVIYTSGSTGNPKGIMIGHESLFNYVRQFIDYFSITNSDVFIQQATVTFDTLVEEIFPALCVSGKIVIARSGGRNIDSLLSLITSHKVSVLSTTPLVLKEINNKVDSRTASLRLAISGGDRLHSSDIDQLFYNVSLYNTYGPSEATVCATYNKIDSLASAALIGRPVVGCSVYILDENRQLLPVGKTGEIYIEGNLALGYLNLPGLTSEKFIDHPFAAGKLLFRSGDLGRWTRTGDIEFMGRIDHQVKIRGHRVEPTEIENALIGNTAVQSAAVLYDTNAGYLIAYLVVNLDYSENDLRLALGKCLPTYMMPFRFVVMEMLPLTPSGKIDRRQLAAHAHDGARDERLAFALPETKTEKLLAAIWMEILNRKEIGTALNFFEAGGNSIKASRMINLISTGMGIELTLSDVFIYPTLQSMAEQLTRVEQSMYNFIDIS